MGFFVDKNGSHYDFAVQILFDNAGTEHRKQYKIVTRGGVSPLVAFGMRAIIQQKGTILTSEHI